MRRRKLFYTLVTAIICIPSFIVGCSSIGKGQSKGQSSGTKETKNQVVACEKSNVPLVTDLIRDYNLNTKSNLKVENMDADEVQKKLKSKEVNIAIGYDKLEEKSLKKEPLAMDGIAVIASKDNNIDSITLEQLKRAYSGKLSDYKELGASAGKVQVVAYDTDLSIQKQFEKSVMEVPVKEKISRDVDTVESVDDMKEKISSDKSSLGFVPGQYKAENAKIIKLNGVNLTADSLKNELYPLRYPIQMYYSSDQKDSLKNVLQYIKSDEGKKIIRKYCVEAS